MGTFVFLSVFWADIFFSLSMTYAWLTRVYTSLYTPVFKIRNWKMLCLRMNKLGFFFTILIQKELLLPSEPPVWLWSSRALAPHTQSIPATPHHSGLLHSAPWLSDSEPEINKQILCESVICTYFLLHAKTKDTQCCNLFIATGVLMGRVVMDQYLHYCIFIIFYYTPPSKQMSLV